MSARDGTTQHRLHPSKGSSEKPRASALFQAGAEEFAGLRSSCSATVLSIVHVHTCVNNANFAATQFGKTFGDEVF